MSLRIAPRADGGLGLDPLQLVLVGTTLEATAFVCEIPTGVVADVYGRRLSVIIGLLLIAFGFLLEGLVPQFAAVLLEAPAIAAADQAVVPRQFGQ